MRSSLTSTIAGISVVCAIRIAIAIMRCRAPGGVHGVERLSFRVDSDVRVVLQHQARQMTADGLEDDVKMLAESGGAPVRRVLTTEEQDRLFEVVKANAEWQHFYEQGICEAHPMRVFSGPPVPASRREPTRSGRIPPAESKACQVPRSAPQEGECQVVRSIMSIPQLRVPLAPCLSAESG